MLLRQGLGIIPRAPIQITSVSAEPQGQRYLLALVREREVIELKQFMAIAGVREELLEQVAHQPGLDAVVIVLAVAPKTDQPRHAEESQMMAHRRLRLFEQLTQSGH